MRSTRRQRGQARAQGLQEAASTIFVLTAVLPLLIFVWVLYGLDVLQYSRAQLGLAMSLGISILGFIVLRITMRRTSAVLQLLVRAETEPDGSSETDVPSAVDDGAAMAAPGVHHGNRLAHAMDSAPAIGAIRELQDAANAVVHRWKRKAETLMGRPVVVSVMNFDEPETGILLRATDDGLVLEHDGQEFGVLWRLVTWVELDPRVAVPVDARR